MQPLANALRTPGDTSEEFRAPLAVCLCENCGLSQLTVVVDPEILYTGYRFRSGTSEAWRKHCADLAEQCGEPGQVLDIACNDNALLDAFHAKGWRCVGVDPAPAIPRISPTYLVLTGSWPAAQRDIALFCQSRFNLVIAQNVLGHVDDPIDFLKGIKAVLAEDGQAVIEVPDMAELLDRMAFDTIYHEHLSYWNARSFVSAAASVGLVAVRREKFPDIHGGTVRYWLEHCDPLVPKGGPTLNSEVYTEAGKKVWERIDAIYVLADYHGTISEMIGWGASAKAAVVLNAIWPQDLDYQGNAMPRYIIDETPEKVGLLMPGVSVPIVAPPDDLSDVDVIWVLVWNWLEQVKEKARARGFRGQFLVTSPRVELVD